VVGERGSGATVVVVVVVLLLLLLLLLLELHSAISRIKHESERCDGAEPSYVA